MNKSNATTTGTSTLANIYNTDGSVNGKAAYEVLKAIGYYGHENDTGTYTAHNIAGRSSSGSDATVIFPMGYYVSKAGVMDTSKPIYWQAVYLSNGYLTIWMNNNYTYDYFNYRTNTNSGWGNGTSYSTYSNYSKSTLRDITNNIYTALSGKLTNFNTFVQSPSEAGANWQKTEKEDVYTWNSSYYDHHNNLYYSSTSSYGGSYTGWAHSNWNSTNQPYSDKFWIPSSAEVFNNVTGSSNQSVEKGLWGLNASDRGFTSANNDTYTIEGNNSTSYCWLRSGYSNLYDYAMLVNSSGSAYNSGVNDSLGVRPACHISLSALDESAVYKITTTVSNDTMGTTTGDGQFSLDGTERTTITATPNVGYVFNYWLEESTGNKIYNNPYTFTVTKEETFTAYFVEGFANITTENNRAEILEEKILYDGIEQKISLSFTTSNYVTKIKFTGDSVSRDIKNIKGTFGDVVNCTAVDYTTNTEGSKLYISVLDPTDSITITLYFTNTAQSYKVASGGGIDTVAVQSTLGGSAELVGDDYANLATGDTITVVARYKLNGYQFDGWYVDGVLVSTDLSVRLTYDDTIKGKVIVARFSKIDSKTNTDTDNTNDFY